MNFPQQQLRLRKWCLVLLCVCSQFSQAADAPDDLPGKDGPFASNLAYSPEATDPSAPGWRPRQAKHHVGLSIGSAIPVIFINLFFAVAVFVDGRRIQQRGGHMQFFGPLLWALATLVGGFIVPAGFWLMHHSSLRTAPPSTA